LFFNLVLISINTDIQCVNFSIKPSIDEIPAAFLSQGQNAVKKAERSTKACQDGSGGMCVETGKCPAELKPKTQNSEACEANQECCFGGKKLKFLMPY